FEFDSSIFSTFNRFLWRSIYCCAEVLYINFLACSCLTISQFSLGLGNVFSLVLDSKQVPIREVGRIVLWSSAFFCGFYSVYVGRLFVPAWREMGEGKLVYSGLSRCKRIPYKYISIFP